MKYALLEHKHGKSGLINIGDHIQSLAAEQYLPKVDFYVEREKLNKKEYGESKIIMNGWFLYEPKNWPPNPRLTTLLTSFHLSSRVADKLLKSKINYDFFKRNEPIGCRDYKTLEIMSKYGINAYYSFCLTSTLDLKYKTSVKTDKIYFIDVLYDYDQRYVYRADPKRILFHVLSGRIFKTLNLRKKEMILNNLVPDIIREAAIDKNHFYDKNLPTEHLFDIARKVITSYASAKLVVTSRIHCAIPCLALGTPVLFILDDALEENLSHIFRFKGILEHINILTNKQHSHFNKIFGCKMNLFHPNDINWDAPPENPKSFLPLAKNLKELCFNFINQ